MRAIDEDYVASGLVTAKSTMREAASVGHNGGVKRSARHLTQRQVKAGPFSVPFPGDPYRRFRDAMEPFLDLTRSLYRLEPRLAWKP